ncbi:hypothetical protein Q4S45_07495 [Massilia sp. R2A-15]|uniref:hypothetical protein n=1 Tax=Massilia sp. R2A-15 TaxID=3064278 RepID=UPI0027328ED2|nr:hypothetical protein [Massilia sp. R2A-15]WLI90952.1 hypothetical protein Q4S45_07495 [Massilia sp. R2A-15]
MNTQFAGKRLMCALAFIGLGVVSGAASAQSQEYRRGYDQGYRDGMAAAQSRGGQEYGGRGRIHIAEALYGVRDASCDAREAVRQMIGRYPNPTITAGNQLCGDPARGARKRLTVTYRCGDSALMRAQADEGDSITLNCQ